MRGQWLETVFNKMCGQRDRDLPVRWGLLLRLVLRVGWISLEYLDHRRSPVALGSRCCAGTVRKVNRCHQATVGLKRLGVMQVESYHVGLEQVHYHRVGEVCSANRSASSSKTWVCCGSKTQGTGHDRWGWIRSFARVRQYQRSILSYFWMTC